MCGCEMCIQATIQQQTFNDWWNIISCDNKSYKRVVFPNGNLLHTRARDVIELIICPYISLGK